MHLFHRAHLTFQYPQPDRYPCNNHRYHAKQASLCDLSVSSTGSISLQQTLVHCESMRQWTTFSILNRIDIPATDQQALTLATQHHVFQYPQPDRYPCNGNKCSLKTLYIILSVSSTGSISLQLEQVLEREAQEEPFSILNRIDIPATSPRSVKLVGENGPFSILNRIDIPATTSTTCIS